MKVLIDGREVPVENDVKIIYDAFTNMSTQREGELHITARHDGVTEDVVFDGEVTASACKEPTDIVMRVERENE